MAANQMQRAQSEDIPLENLSRSSTPTLGSGKAIPISKPLTIQMRNSPKKNHSFDGGISVSSSPAATAAGFSASPMGSSSPAKQLQVVAPVAVVVESSQETSFMGGPEEEVQGVEEEVENDQARGGGGGRKGMIETV